VERSLWICQPFPSGSGWQIEGLSSGWTIRSLAQSYFVEQEPRFLHPDRNDTHVRATRNVCALDFRVSKVWILTFSVTVNEQNLTGVKLKCCRQSLRKSNRSCPKASQVGPPNVDLSRRELADEPFQDA
jgi:hypothetical protein